LGVEDAEQAAARRARDSPVTLVTAALLDADGRPRQVFETGETLVLALELEARGGARDVDVVIDVRQAGGPSVVRSRRAAGTSAGSGRLVLEVPQLRLLGGDYDIAIAVQEPGDEDMGTDRLLSFSVAATDGAEGIADLRGSWTYTGARIEVGR